MHSLVARVSDRYLIAAAAKQAVRQGHSKRTATDNRILLATLTAIGEHAYLPQHRGKVAFFGLAKKLTQLAALFTKNLNLWDHFKKMVGIDSLSDIPAAIRDLIAKGKRALNSALDKLFSTWPLKIYTLEKGKLKGINSVLDHLSSKHPKFKSFLTKATQTVSDFGESIRKQAPHIIGIAMMAIYIYVWVNVAEFEWDLKSLADAVIGRLDFPTFLASLPSSALGALISGLTHVGTFTLLPYTIAARILYLIGHRYLTWTGSGFVLDRDALSEDFGIELTPQEMKT